MILYDDTKGVVFMAENIRLQKSEDLLNNRENTSSDIEDSFTSVEEEYTLYKQKVFRCNNDNDENNLKKAIRKFIALKEEVEADAITGHNNDGVIDYNNELVLRLERLVDKNVLKVNVVKTSSKKQDRYYKEIFTFIDEYMRKIANGYCPNFEQEITGAGRFCSNCGEKLI